MTSRLVAILAFALTIAAHALASEDSPVTAASRRRGAPQPTRWWSPSCTRVEGFGAVTFTRDEGRNVVVSAPLTRLGYTLGLVAVDTPNVLVAVHSNLLVRSLDAGCSWSTVTEIGGIDFPPYLVAAREGRVYGWSDGRNTLFRFDGTTVQKLTSPVETIIGFAADAQDGTRIRIGGGDASIWESLDGGLNWTRIGGLRSDAPFLYRITFDPSDLNHIVAGTAVAGGFYSRDGGATWQPSAGLRMTGGTNVFNIVISPFDGSVVWAMGLNLAESDANAASQGKHIFRSSDGGATFSAVVDASPDVTLVNGPLMAAHPTNSNVLYFVFGTYFQGYGTDIFRYDAASRTLTKTHNDHDDVGSITFSPADPSIMYLGIVEESIR